MTDPDRRRSNDRFLEVIAVVLLGMATIGSAWCGYQAAQWNGEESKLARLATDERVEASRLFALATQTIAYDSNVIGQYAQAVQGEDEKLEKFIRETLIRPEFQSVLKRWKAQVDAGGSPTNLLRDEEYLKEQIGPYEAADAKAADLAAQSQGAGRNADDYVLTTLSLAVALFFAGVAGSFKFRSVRIMLLLGATVTIGVTAARLIDLPVV